MAKQKYLFVNEIATERVNQQIPRRGADGEDFDIIKYQPRQSGQVLGLDRGEFGYDLGGRVAGIGPLEDKDN